MRYYLEVIGVMKLKSILKYYNNNHTNRIGTLKSIGVQTEFQHIFQKKCRYLIKLPQLQVG